MRSMNTWILFMQVSVISAVAVTLAMGIKFTVPIIHTWLRPPYLHILINAIIIAIAAVSRCGKIQSEPPVQPPHSISVTTPPPMYYAEFSVPPEVRIIVEVPQEAAVAEDEGEDTVVDLKPVMVNGSEVDVDEGEEAEDAFFDQSLAGDPQTPEIFSPESQLECILPAKPTRNITEKAIRDAKHESLENTWKKIMQERSPLTTNETPHEVRHVGPPRPSSRSFKEMTNNKNYHLDPTSLKIQKEVSPSQEELNRRIEEFIKKVNNEMRLGRQESLDQYMEMINGGI